MNDAPHKPQEHVPDIAELSRRLDQLSKALAHWVRGYRAGMSRLLDEEPTSWLAGGPAEAARILRRMIRRRRMRSEMFPLDLFADPAWDILLELTVARLEKVPVPVSSLCIAAAVPTTTALRWINTMVDAGWLARRSDPHDRRRIFIELTPDGWQLMSNYFSRLTVDNDGAEPSR